MFLVVVFGHSPVFRMFCLVSLDLTLRVSDTRRPKKGMAMGMMGRGLTTAANRLFRGPSERPHTHV